MSSGWIIRNARVIDGTGVPWFHADVLVRGERIEAMLPPGQADDNHADEVIDAGGMVLCPGFIDIQSHSITSIFEDGRLVSKISQGITTEIMGETWTPAPVNENLPSRLRSGRGWPRFGQWLDAMVEHGVSANVGSFLAGHNIRGCVMGMRLGEPTPEEIQAMQRVVADAMAEGAFGVAYALIYPPDAYTTTEEIVAICRTAREYGGMYITHVRSEGDRYIEAIDEAIAIGRRAEIPVEIYHLKVCGKANWHKMPQAIERINAARAQGLDIAANMYPYAASGTGLTAVLPPWAEADGRLYDNLDDPAMRRKIRQEVLQPTGEWEPQLQIAGAENIMPIELHRPEHEPFVGQRLDAIAQMMDVEPVDAAIELLRVERQRIATIYFKMDEANMGLQIREPWVKFSTDAPASNPATATHPVHPRSYGTMPRFLGRYVREQQVLPLEQAIARMTWHVARRLGLADRGQLRPGAMADLVLFDPDTVADRATYDDSHQLSEGIVGVWVNGLRVWGPTGHTGKFPGQAVRHQPR